MKYLIPLLLCSCTLQKGVVIDKLTVVSNYHTSRYIYIHYNKNNRLKSKYLHCNEMQYNHFKKNDSIFFKGILLY